MIGIDQVCAVLALEYGVLDAPTAWGIIELASHDPVAAEAALLNEVSESALLSAIATELGYEYVNLSSSDSGLKSDPETRRQADDLYLRQVSALPMLDRSGQVTIVAANPTNPDLIAYVRKIYGQPRIVLGSRAQIQSRLVLSGSTFADGLPNEPVVTEQTAEAAPAVQRNPLVAWVDRVLEAAVAQEASDIHFVFTDSRALLLRFRIDGVLREYPAPMRGREGEIIGIIMNRAGMDAANQREPQDGTFQFNVLGRKVDIRVGMLPQANGTSLVLRILDSNNVRRRLTDMGFSRDQLTMMLQAVHSPQGTIIVCGPTGSGKTTTLYALVREVATIEKNVMTIEDPIEYRLPLVNQTAVTHSADGRAISFETALRAIMRMDPDVILVGEIRDTETARTAMDAAITGHLVLSTVHTRGAVGIYTRLVEMGVPNYMVADAMTLGVSQRLARRLHSCARPRPVDDIERATFAEYSVEIPERLMHPTGCDACQGTGYLSRVAVVEILRPTVDFRRLVLDGAGHDDLMDQARSDGFVPMVQAGLGLVLAGATTVAEVLRVAASG